MTRYQVECLKILAWQGVPHCEAAAKSIASEFRSKTGCSLKVSVPVRRSLGRYHAVRPIRSGIVFGYGAVDLPEIERGLSKLHDALKLQQR